MKKFLYILIFAVFASMPLLITACSDIYEDMSISLDSEEISISIDSDETVFLVATVTGAPSGSSKGVAHSFSDEGVVAISKQEVDGGKTTYKITPLMTGETKLTIKTIEGDKTKSVSIDVFRELETMSLKPSLPENMFSGDSLNINPSDFFEFYPGNATRKELRYSLVEQFLDEEVTITSNGLIQTSEDFAGDVSIVVTSVYNEEISIEFKITVIQPISEEDIFITTQPLWEQYSELDEQEQEGFELFIDSITLANNLQQFSYEQVLIFVDTENDINIGVSSTNPGVAEVVSWDQSTKMIYAANIGNTDLDINISIKNIDIGTVAKRKIPVEVVDFASSVSLESDFSDYKNVAIFDYYANGLGEQISVSVMPRHAFNRDIRLYVPTEYHDMIFIRFADGQKILPEEINQTVLSSGASLYISVNEEYIGQDYFPEIYFLSKSSTVNYDYEDEGIESFSNIIHKKVSINPVKGPEQIIADFTDIEIKEGSEVPFSIGFANTEAYSPTIKSLVSTQGIIDITKVDKFNYEILGVAPGSTTVTFTARNNIYTALEVVVYRTLQDFKVLVEHPDDNRRVVKKALDENDSLESATLAWQSEFSLDFQYDPSATIRSQSFSSTNPNVAYVSSQGFLFTNAEGIVDITVEMETLSREDDYGATIVKLTKTFSITTFIPVQSISLNHSSVEILADNYAGVDDFSNPHLEKPKIEISMNPSRLDTSSENINVYFNYDEAISIDNGYISGRHEGLSPGGSVTKYVSVSVEQYGRYFTRNIIVLIRRPIKVDVISVENLDSNGHVYFDARKDMESIDINPVALPFEAHNRTITYEYLGSNSSDPVFELSSGVITPLRAGRSTVRLIAQDSLTEERYLHGLGPSIFREIDVIVADGATKEAALQISSIDDFNMINTIDGLNLHYVLNTDIDFENFAFTPIGFIDGEVKEFTGSLNGSFSLDEGDSIQYGIRNININSFVLNEIGKHAFILNNAGEIDNLNLFYNETDVQLDGGNISQYKISALTITNDGSIRDAKVDMGSLNIMSSNNADINFGGLAVYNDGLIEKSVIEGSLHILGDANDVYVGGVVTINTGIVIGNFENIHSEGEAFSNVLYDKEGMTSILDVYIDTSNGSSAAGLIAARNRANLINVAVDGIIHAKNNVGGLVGINNGSIENSYSSAKVFGAENIGGIAGNSYISDDVDYNIINHQITETSVEFFDRGELYNGTSAHISGTNNVGGIVGYVGEGFYRFRYNYVKSYYSGSESTILGDIELNNSSINNPVIGGLIGYYNGGQNSRVEQSFFDANIRIDSDVSNLEEVNVGGIIGVVEGPIEIFETYANLSVIYERVNDPVESANFLVGGLVAKLILDDDQHAEIGFNYYKLLISGMLGSYGFEYSGIQEIAEIDATEASDYNMNLNYGNEGDMSDIITYDGWDIGDNEIWNHNPHINQGKPHLMYFGETEGKPFLPILPMYIEVDIKDSVEGHHYAFSDDDSNINNRAIIFKNSANAYHIKDLIEEIADTRGIQNIRYYAESSDTDVIEIGNTGEVIINSVGDVTIKVSLLQNINLNTTFNISVVPQVSYFGIYSDSTYNNKLDLEQGIVIRYNETKTIHFKSLDANDNESIEHGILFRDQNSENLIRVDDFEFIDNELRFDNKVSAIINGHNVGNASYSIVPFFKIFDNQGNQMYFELEELAYNTNMHIYTGAKGIASDTDSLSISTSNEAIISLYLDTDSDEDDVLVEFDSENIIVEEISNVEGPGEYIFNIKANSNYLDFESGENKLTESLHMPVKFYSYTNNDIYHETVVTLSPSKLARIDSAHFPATKIERVDGEDRYYPEEAPSRTIVPGEPGILEVSVYPEYANVDFYTISYTTNSNASLSFAQVVNINTQGAPYQFVRPQPQSISNGLKLNKLSRENTSGDVVFDGNFYIKTLVSSNARRGDIFNLEINGYTDQNGVVRQVDVSHNFTLEAGAVPGVHIRNTESLVARGSIIPLDIEVIEFDGQVDVFASTAGNYYNDEAYDDINIARESRIIIRDDKHYLSVGFAVSPGSQITVVARVSRVVGGIVQTSESTLNLTVVNFIIEDVNFKRAVSGSSGYDIFNMFLGERFRFSIKIDSISVRPEMFDLPEMYSYNYNIGWFDTLSPSAKTQILTMTNDINDEISNTAKQFENNLSNWYIRHAFNTNSYSQIVAGGGIYEHFRVGQRTSEINGEETYNYIVAEKTGQSRRLRGIFNYNYSDGILIPHANGVHGVSTDFVINITASSTRDNPIPIYNLDEFKGISENGDYILMTDLVLRNWEPLDVNIRSLDGNGFYLNLESFYANADQGNYKFGIFNTVHEQSIIKNLKVNLFNFQNELNAQEFDNVDLGIIAAENRGAIHNSEVVLSENAFTENIISLNSSESSFDKIVNQKTEVSIIFNDLTQSQVQDYQDGYLNVSSDKDFSVKVAQYDNVLELRIDTTEHLYAHTIAVKHNDLELYNITLNIRELNDLEIDLKTASYSNTRASMFVAVNSGDITNSRVNSEMDHSRFILNSRNDLGGFTVINSGIITASYINDISLFNTSQGSQGTRTAGFVVENTNQSRVSNSYIEGGSMQRSTIANNSGMVYSKGNTAAFVYINRGGIYDSYANIPTISESRSSGFVFINEGDASIKRVYTASKVKGNSMGHQPFIGNNALDELNDGGQFEHTYFLGNDKYLIPPNYPAAQIQEPQFDAIGSFRGFTFNTRVSEDFGVWRMENIYANDLTKEYVFAPQLISPNTISDYRRVLTDEREDSKLGVRYSYQYVDPDNPDEIPAPGSDFIGSSLRSPIIVADALEFIEAFTLYAVHTERSSGDKGHRVESSEWGSSGIDAYTDVNIRIISNIDFNDVTDTSEIRRLHNITYNGVLDGNGMSLKNVRITSPLVQHSTRENFGLFNQIGSESGNVSRAGINYINIDIAEISATMIDSVGSLAGTIINTKVVNLDVTGSGITVQGRSFVGGLAGRILGHSDLSNITSNVSVSSEYRTTETTENGEDIDYGYYDPESSNKKLSYAGGIAGIIDIDWGDSITQEQLEIMKDEPNIMGLKVYDNVQIRGETVGGVAGYLGELGFADNIVVELSNQYPNPESSQTLAGYNIVGGLVGLNRGKIYHSYIEHEKEYQLQEVDTATPGSASGIQILFNGEANFAGGLVGYNNSGEIRDSYSRVDINNNNSKISGGAVGLNYGGRILNVYATGNVDARDVVGGAIGAIIKQDSEYGGYDSEEENQRLIIQSFVAANNWQESSRITSLDLGDDEKLDNFGAIVGRILLSQGETTPSPSELSNYIHNDNHSSEPISYISDVAGTSIQNLIQDYTYENLKNEEKLGFIPDPYDDQVVDQVDYADIMQVNSSLAGDVYRGFATSDSNVVSYWSRNYTDFGNYPIRFPRLRLGNIEMSIWIDANVTPPEEVMEALRINRTRNIYLIGDVDLTDTEYVHQPISGFRGNLIGLKSESEDNDNNTETYPRIFGLRLNANSADNVGLFTSLNTTNIHNLSIQLIEVVYDDDTGNKREDGTSFGALAGRISNSNIENIHVTVDLDPPVESLVSSQYMGMIAGLLQDVDIDDFSVKILNNLNMSTEDYSGATDSAFYFGVISGFAIINGNASNLDVEYRKLNFEIKQDQNDIYIGGVFGLADSINRLYNVTANTDIDSEIPVISGISLDAGGKTDSSSQIHLGGMSGKISAEYIDSDHSDLKNDHVVHIITDLKLKNATQSLNFVGTFAGILKGDELTFKDSKVEKSEYGILVDTESVAASGILRIAGLAGRIDIKSKVDLKNVIAYTDIYVNAGGSSAAVRVAGLVAQISGLDIETTITNEIETVMFKGDISVNNTDGSAFVAGLISITTSQEGTLNNSFAYTNFDVRVFPEDTYQELIIGGLIGSNNGTNIENSYVAGTLNVDNTRMTGSIIGGLVGRTYNSDIEIKNSYNAMFMQVDNHTHENVSIDPVNAVEGVGTSVTVTNVFWSSVLSSISTRASSYEINDVDILDGISSSSSDLSDDVWVWKRNEADINFPILKSFNHDYQPDQSEGTRLNPLKIDDAEDFDDNSSHYVINSDLEITIDSDHDENNPSVLFSGDDGILKGSIINPENYKITVVNSDNRAFSLINKLARRANIYNIHLIVDVDFYGDAISHISHYSPLVNVNEGIIYRAGVVGKIVYRVEETKYIGAIAGKNSGNIHQSFAHIDYYSEVSNLDIFIGGLVGLSNNGLIEDSFFTGELDIDTSHSAGGITAAETNNSFNLFSYTYSSGKFNNSANSYPIMGSNNDGSYYFKSDTVRYDKHAFSNTLANVSDLQSQNAHSTHTMAALSSDTHATETLVQRFNSGLFDDIWVVPENDYIYNYGYPYFSYINNSDSIYTQMLDEMFTGDGSSEDPYLINHVGRFDFMRLYPNKSFLITSDIDFSEIVNFISIGYNTNLSKLQSGHYRGYVGQAVDFTGDIVGQEYTISNLSTIYDEGHDKEYAVNQGVLFARLRNAQIENLTISDFNITINNLRAGNNYISAFAGTSEYSEIKNINVEDLKIKHINTENKTYVGGLIGKSTDDDIGSIDLDFQIELGSSGTGNIRAGGLAGEIFISKIDQISITNNSSIESKKVGLNSNKIMIGGIAGEVINIDFDFNILRDTEISHINVETSDSENGDARIDELFIGAAFGRFISDNNDEKNIGGDLISDSLVYDSFSIKVEVELDYIGSIYIGGLIGDLQSNELNAVDINISPNIDVSVSSNNGSEEEDEEVEAFIAGIFGRVQIANIQNIDRQFKGINDSFEAGSQSEKVLNVTIKAPIDNLYVSGIFGYIVNNTQSDYEFSNIYNYYNIDLETNDNFEGRVYLGSIIGKFETTGELDNYNLIKDVGNKSQEEIKVASKNLEAFKIGNLFGWVDRSNIQGELKITKPIINVTFDTINMNQGEGFVGLVTGFAEHAEINANNLELEEKGDISVKTEGTSEEEGATGSRVYIGSISGYIKSSKAWFFYEDNTHISAEVGNVANYYIGGIVGGAYGETSKEGSSGTIINNNFGGNIDVELNESIDMRPVIRIGGIAGENNGSPRMDGTNQVRDTFVANSIYSGNITFNHHNNSGQAVLYMGGVVGENRGKISTSDFDGSINYNMGQGLKNSYVEESLVGIGGIAGRLHHDSRVTQNHSSNDSQIKINIPDVHSKIGDVYNDNHDGREGSIDTSGYYIGGYAGFANTVLHQMVNSKTVVKYTNEIGVDISAPNNLYVKNSFFNVGVGFGAIQNVGTYSSTMFIFSESGEFEYSKYNQYHLTDFVPSIEGSTDDVDQIIRTDDPDGRWDDEITSNNFSVDNDRLVIDSAELLAKVADRVNRNLSFNLSGYEGDYRNANYVLTEDIDLSGKLWTPIANRVSSSDPEAPFFSGTFDGNGHVIRGMIIKESYDGTNASQYHGLFGYLGGATIENLGVVGNIDVYAKDQSENVSVGAISGRSLGETKIENVWASVNITLDTGTGTGTYSNNSLGYVGGLIGVVRSNTTTISNSFVRDVNIYVSSARYIIAGGLIGRYDTNYYKDNNITSIVSIIINSYTSGINIKIVQKGVGRDDLRQWVEAAGGILGAIYWDYNPFTDLTRWKGEEEGPTLTISNTFTFNNFISGDFVSGTSDSSTNWLTRGLGGIVGSTKYGETAIATNARYASVMNVTYSVTQHPLIYGRTSDASGKITNSYNSTSITKHEEIFSSSPFKYTPFMNRNSTIDRYGVRRPLLRPEFSDHWMLEYQ